MAKKAKTKFDPDREDHRRWCVEQASCWPTVQTGSGYNNGMSIGSPIQTMDADLIGRAKKIEAYLTDNQ